jgi:hypothetical protein
MNRLMASRLCAQTFVYMIAAVRTKILTAFYYLTRLILLLLLVKYYSREKQGLGLILVNLRIRSAQIFAGW